MRSPRPDTLALALALLATACRPRTADAPRAPDAPAARPLDAPAAPVLAPEAPTSRWAVTAAEAQGHGMSPLGFAFEPAPRSLIATRFPAPGTLAVFSGPTGAPLGILVEADALSGGDAPSLRDALVAARAPRIGSPRTPGEVESLPLGGVVRPAVALLAGAGPARTLYCVFLVAPPEAVSRGLLVWFYATGQRLTAARCADVFDHPQLDDAARAFRLLAPTP